jgi:tetratricopeptide (TPR) repeat protein
MDGAFSLKESDLSNYAMGYAYFQRKERSENKNNDDYANANIAFRKFLLSKSKFEEDKIVDATLRAADCYFMNKDYPQAAEYYNKVIEANKIDVDYALYQKAQCDGLNKKFSEKVNELKKIESRYPNSNYQSAAVNEIAKTYVNNLKDDENAIVYYNKILKNYPNSSFAADANAQLGNIYFNRKEDDKAFAYYDKFVKSDPNSEAAKLVYENIKKIFTEKGKIDEMEKYFASIGNPLSENELERKTYDVAYDAFYNQKSCETALPLWQNYISKFPNGKHITEAQFNAAECEYSKSNYEKALPGYKFVIEKQRGLYSEVSYAKAAYIYYKDKKYADALPLFQQLQEIAETPSNKSAGRFGAMRSAFYLNQFETALTECTKVLSTEKLSPQQQSEAKYIKAKSLFELNRLDDALIEFKAISKSAKNITGAEAYYHVALIHFKKQEHKEVEKTINKLISYEYSNDDWNNKGMLLLADMYLAKGDDADAQVILESIIDNKAKQEYIDEAKKRLDALKAKQNEQQRSSESADPNKDMKVDLNRSKKDEDLFDKMYKEYEQNKSVPTNTTVEQPK